MIYFKTIGVHNLEILHFKVQVMKTYQHLFQVVKNREKWNLFDKNNLKLVDNKSTDNKIVDNLTED